MGGTPVPDSKKYKSRVGPRVRELRVLGIKILLMVTTFESVNVKDKKKREHRVL